MKRWLTVCLIVLLGGCARYQPRPLSPQQTEAHFRHRTLNDDGLHAFISLNFTNAPVEWPLKKFDLDTLTLVAFYFHPDLEVARAQVALAKAGEITAGERPNPSVSVTPTFVPNSEPGMTPWLVNLSWDIPIETAGKREHRIVQAKQLTRSAQAALGEAAWKVRSRLRAALLEVFLSQLESSLAQNELNLRTQLVKSIETQLQFGEVSRFELNLAQTDLLNARISARRAKSQINDARLGVAAALGLPAAGIRNLQFPSKTFERGAMGKKLSSDVVQTAGLLNRLDVERALADYAASEAALQLEIAKQYPDVHLSPGYEFDQGQHKFSLGVGTTLPIFNQNKGAIAEAEAKRKQTAANFLSIQTEAISQTEKASAAYRAAQEEWREANRAVIEIQDRLQKSTKQAVEAGELDRPALLNAQLQKTVAMRARLESLRRVQTALGAMEDAVQRPLDESVHFSVVLIPEDEKPDRTK